MATIEEIIKTLTVSEENVSEMREIFGEKINDNDLIASLILKDFEQYAQEAGESELEKLPLIHKAIFLYKAAMDKGYALALRDVQTVQALDLEDIRAGG